MLQFIVVSAVLLSPCEVKEVGAIGVDIKCPLPSSETVRRLRFTARFSGGHDDTRASLGARLNEQPLTCDDGSKTELEAEEGEISLHCTFSIPAGATTHSLMMQIRWHHAQYMDFELAPSDAGT